MARVVMEFDGHLATPERLNQRQMLRLAAAARAGFTALIRHALTQSHATSLPRQWQVLEAVLAEAEVRSPHPIRCPIPSPAAPAASSPPAPACASAENLPPKAGC